MSRLTKDEILNRTNGGLDIYQYVVSKKGQQVTLKTGKNSALKNPFYDDKNPSLSIFNQGGIYLYKDFGDDRYHGDAFDFYGKYSNLDTHSQFRELLDSISREILSESPGGDRQDMYSNSMDSCNIEFGSNLNYWTGLFPNRDLLVEKARSFGLRSVKSCKAGNASLKWSDYDPIFGFQIGGAFKIYRPLNPNGSKHFWDSKHEADYSHYLRLLDTSKPVLITEGYKDAFSAYVHGFNVFPLDNAQSRIPEEISQWFKQNTIRPVICLDNDKAGKKGTQRLAEELGFPSITLPEEFSQHSVKDLTDLLRVDTGKDWLQDELRKSDDATSFRSPNLRAILRDRDKINERAKGPISWSKPLLCLNGQGFIYENTINTIIGPPGTHKSRICECFASAALSKSASRKSGIALHDEKEPVAVLYVDTERNHKDQLPYAIQQIRRLASGDPFRDVEHFDAVSLVSLTRSERFETLREYLTNEIQRSDQHLMIVIDVVTDCVVDFNRVDDSLELNDFMNEMINQEDVTFVVVIHANPSSTKARGHLGTELANKSSYVGALDVVDDRVIELSTKKLRVGKPLEKVYFKYDPNEKHLVQTDHTPTSSGEIQKKAAANKIVVYLRKYPANKEIDTKSLKQEIGEMFECSERTAEERIKQITDDKMPIDVNGRPHILIRSKKGTVVIKLKETQTQLTIGENAVAED